MQAVTHIHDQMPVGIFSISPPTTQSSPDMFPCFTVTLVPGCIINRNVQLQMFVVKAAYMRVTIIQYELSKEVNLDKQTYSYRRQDNFKWKHQYSSQSLRAD